MTENPDTVADVRAWVDRLRSSLPQSVDVAALGVKSKAPFQLLCTREALIWRTEELARNACDALERDDFAAAAILTRAVTENAALAWQLLDVLEARAKYTPQKLNDLLMRLLGGSKAWPEAPKPVHVHDGLRKMDKKIPGVLSSYDSLSEMTHPNSAGVVGLYSKDDKPNFIMHFGRGLRGVDSSRGMITNAMLGSLGAFEYAYNRIADLMPAFLAELESIWSDDSDEPDSAAG
jgi:hypothetical protein